MKIAAFALVCLVAFASASSLDTILAREGAASDSFAAFQGFMAKFDRVYDSPSVMAERFAIFQENMREAAELNRAHPRTTFGVTRFSDMTRAEWEAEYTIAFPKTNIPAAENLVAPKAKSVFAAPPNAVDWRPQLNPIKDQKACGSCWAFSAMSAAEGALVAAGQDNVDGSEQHLVDCDADSAGCAGGWMHTAIGVLGRDGIFKQEDYPYTASDGSCSASDHEPVASIAGVNVRCANLAFLPDDVRTDDNCNDDDTKIAVAENGAQSIAINANLMMSYQSGIIQADSSSCYEEGLNHGVDIVGYDEEDGLEYYIVRNSWGSRWGEEGYFRIETGTNACGIDIYQVEAVL